MNSRQSWVPLGTMRSTCSSPNTAVNHDQGVRLTVSKQEAAAGGEHPGQLGHGRREVGQVLEHVGGDHGVEAAVGEREPFQAALGGPERPR